MVQSHLMRLIRAEGTHTYTVREKAGTDTNIDYDSMNAVVTVNVTKDAANRSFERCCYNA